MTEKRRGLGKGLGALIPSAPADGRPVDVFFPDQRPAERAARGDYVVLPTDSRSAASAPSATSAREATPASTATPAAARGTTSAGTKPRTNGTRRTTTKRAKIPADTLTPRRRPPTAPSIATPEAAPQPAADRPQPAPAETTPGTPTQAHAAEAAPATSAPQPPASPEAAPGTEDTGLVAVPGAAFAEVAVEDVVANRRQPRQVFDEEELEELAASIREVGVLQPIVVRRLPDGEAAGYELIMGERRWRASQLAGNETVPAIVRQVEDDDLLRDALLENLHRSQLNPLEEAAAYQQLLEDFGCTHEELASRIVRSRPQISNTLRLLKLPPLVQRRVAAGVLSAGHARALLGLADAGAMERLAQRIVAEGLSVRSTEEIVALGDEPIDPELRRRPRTTAHTAELNELATRLADRFDTRVKIGMGQRKGRINIEFASVEDLNRILDVLAPEVDRVPAQPGRD